MTRTRPSSRRAPARLAGRLALLGVLGALSSCGEDVTVVAVDVATVQIDPPGAQLVPGEALDLTATVRDASGRELQRPVQWQTEKPEVATVDATGRVRAVAAGSTTITAIVERVSDDIVVQVGVGPAITLSDTEVSFQAAQGGQDPAPLTLRVENAAGGALTGLGTSVSYAPGQPGGWLTASLAEASAPTDLVLRASTGSLPAGTYGASVAVVSPRASNNPQLVDVTFTVAPPGPAIGVSSTVVGFTGSRDDPPPASRTVAITNIGGGTLTGLAAAVSYASGQPGGWLSAGLSRTTAPADLTLEVDITGLEEGTFDATVAVSSPVAANSPREVSVRLAIGNPPPEIGLEQREVSFAAAAGEPSPAAQGVGVINLGVQPLTGLSASVAYTSGQPTGWLQATLAGGSAPTTLTLTPSTSSLPAGSYSARVAVASAVAVNSPQHVDVTLVVQPRADLRLEKDAAGSVAAGDTLEYEVFVRNEGPSPASQVLVLDSLPAGVTFLSASSGGGAGSGVVSWSLGTLASGAERVLSARVLAPSGGSLLNRARVRSATVDPLPGNNADTARTQVLARADVSVLKSGPDTVVAADTLRYTLVVSNEGPSAASGVVVTDTLPAAVTFVSASQDGSAAGRVVTWELGSLAVGSPVTLTVTARAPAAGTLLNVAASTAATEDPEPGNNDGSAPGSRVTTAVAERADVSVSKTGPSTIPAGRTITYQVVVRNAGPSVARGVVVTDTLPGAVTFVSASAGGTFAGGVVTWPTIATLAAGDSVSYTLRADAPTTGSFTNLAAATSTTPDPVPGNDDGSAAASRVTTTVSEQADLALTKSATPDPVPAGENLTYTITATNHGPSAATGVEVAESLPAGVTIVTSTETQGDFEGGSGTWDVGSLPRDASATLTIVVSVPADADGSLTNSATISGDQADPASGNDSASTTTPITGVADLQVTLAASVTHVRAGEQLGYTVTARNMGPSDATGVAVEVELPGGVSFVSANPAGSYNSATGLWTIGDLASRSSVTLSILMVVDPETRGQITGTVSIDGDQPDPVSGNDSDSETTVVTGGGNLSVSKADSPDPVTAGSEVTYTVTAENDGPSQATAVTVVEDLPEGTSFGSATATQGSFDGSSGTWDVGTLDVGAVATMTLIVHVEPSASGSLSSTSTIDAAETDPDPSDNSDTETTSVASASDLAIAKSDAPDPVTAGQNLTYTLTATNGGPSDAAGVTVTESLPADVTFVSATPSQGSYSDANDTWSVGTLADGASASLSLVVAVDPGVRGEITSAVSIDGSQPDPVPGNDADDETTTVTAAADLGVLKSAPLTALLVDTITYSLTATNHGPSDATGVTVTDVLPAGVTWVEDTPSQGSYDPETGVWTVGVLPDQASATLEIRVEVNAIGVIENGASIAGEETDPNAGNDSASAITVAS